VLRGERPREQHHTHTKMKLFQALLLAAFAGISSAHCPNFCSMHGTCGANDLCTCYLKSDGQTPAWSGPDCSERTCPT
jgi:hypothetical protein